MLSGNFAVHFFLYEIQLVQDDFWCIFSSGKKTDMSGLSDISQ